MDRPMRQRTAAIADVPHWFVLLVVTGILVRGGVSPYLWNSIVPYQEPGGSLIVKIHPGSYLLAMLAAWVFLTKARARAALWSAAGAAAIVLTAGIGLLLGLALVRGQTSSVGYLVDSILIAPAIILCVLPMTKDQRERVVKAVIGLALANSAFSLLQVALQSHIMPFPYFTSGVGFRASGLLGHPLLTGAHHVVAVLVLQTTTASPRVKAIATAFLLLGTLAGQARVATIISTIVVALIVLRGIRAGLASGRLDPIAFFVTAVCLVALLPTIVLAVTSSGALDRILAGLNDESARARVDVYRIFQFLSDQEYLFGTDLEYANRIMRNVLKLEHIESPFVVYTLQFGLVGALLFSLSLVAFFLLLAVTQTFHVRLAAAAYVAIALTNNQLAAKGPSLALATALLIGASRLQQQKPHRRQNAPYRRQTRQHLVASRVLPGPP